MTLPALATHEIGSLAKTPWRVKAFSGIPLEESDVQDAVKWGIRLNIDEKDSLLELLSKKKDFTPEEKSEIVRFSSLYAIKLMENAGLDLVWDGEQHRVEMYEYPIRRMSGFVFHGHVRSFDHKYYRKASCIQEPGCEVPYHIQEYKEITALAKKQIKIPLTGAYTIVDWSFDEYYMANVVPGKTNIHQVRHEARRQFLHDITKNVIHPNIKALYDQGVRYIQIDEPAATTKKDEIPDFVETMRQTIGDLAGKAFFSTHICFSDYRRLFPDILSLVGILDEIHFEYANRDSKELGVDSQTRKGYEILHHFKNTSFKVGLGVLDVHTDFIESPELVRDRILYAIEILGDPSRIFVAPDCGLRTRSWDIAFEKLRNMVEGRHLAAKALDLSHIF